MSHIVSALEATLAVIDRCPATGRDLEAAVFAAATAMITQARPNESAQLGEHVRATLRRNVESHDLLHEGRTVLVVLQVPLEPLPSK